MIRLAVVFLSAIIVSEQDISRALDLAKAQNEKRALERCVTYQAYRYARFTAEAASNVADFAAQACAKEIDAFSRGGATPFSSIFSSITSSLARTVIEWRARAGENGMGEYDVIKREIDSRFCELKCQPAAKP